MRAECRIYHFQHVGSGRLNCSSEGIVLVSDLSLDCFVFCADVCTHTHKQTSKHKKTISKDHNKEIMWSDIYSDRFISPV